jgi:DNA methyltransferase 1-associated protein 1
MASSSDVRAILELPQQGGASSSVAAAVQRRVAPASRKPDGISRELYALIGDNAPFLAETQASLTMAKYRERPKTKGKDAKWSVIRLSRLENAAECLGSESFSRLLSETSSRRDAYGIGRESVMISQERVVSTRLEFRSSRAVEYFATFNQHGPSIMEYSQYEYDQHLVDPNWTAHETTYLFDMLRTYDLRFIVVADRYEYQAPQSQDPPRSRSVEVSVEAELETDSRTLKIATILFAAD